LDIAQAKGLELALYELNLSKNWKTHLMYIFKSCVKKLRQETNSQMKYEVMAELETIVNVINSDSDNEISKENKVITQTTGNKENDPLLSIELEERKIALLECQVKARKEAAEAEAIELQN
ncbi:19868_t:CDS:2, partial [Cetraspora pellucida]